MKMGAVENKMPLFCELGWHRPEPVARWNSGYYFTRCARCGEDLVRTAYGRWQVPHGYRVVWQAQPPANAVSAALVQEPAASPPAGARELPIQEVLRHLQNGEPPAAKPPADIAPTIPHELISRAVPAPMIPDFMDEATGASAWEAPSRTYLLRPERGDRGRDADAAPQEEKSGTGFYSRLKPRFTALFERERGEALPAPIGEREAPAGISQNLRLALIAVVPVMLVLLALLVWAGWEDGPTAGREDNSAQSAAIGPGSGVPAFVTASALNCRAAPALEAESLEVLTRGDPVLLLARDGEWASVVREGGQCWALLRYLSRERPI